MADGARLAISAGALDHPERVRRLRAKRGCIWRTPSRQGNPGLRTWYKKSPSQCGAPNRSARTVRPSSLWDKSKEGGVGGGGGGGGWARRVPKSSGSRVVEACSAHGWTRLPEAAKRAGREGKGGGWHSITYVPIEPRIKMLRMKKNFACVLGSFGKAFLKTLRQKIGWTG